MSGTSSPQGGLTRRSFLKTTGAVAGTAAVGSAVTPSLQALASGDAPVSNEEQIFHCVCRVNCGGGVCGMNVHVRGGKAMKVSTKTDVPEPEGMEGFAYSRRPCLKGRSHVQWIYHPDRVKYPLRRVEGTERGAGQWERISWEEAIDEIASKFNSFRKEFGSQSIALPLISGNSGACQGNHPLGGRFANVIEGTIVDSCLDMGIWVGEARVMGGYQSLQGSGNNYWDFKKSKTILLWGLNLTESQIQSWSWLQKAHEAGTKLVCIDPRYTILASKSDRFVPVRPGSDSALVQALINVVFARKLYDEPYVLEHTVAPYLVREDTGLFLRMSDLGVAPTEGAEDPLTGKKAVIDPVVVWDEVSNTAVSEKDCLKPSLFGEYDVDGVKTSTAFELLNREVADNTPEWAADLVGIEESAIVELAEMVADGPCSVQVGFGFDRLDNGDIVAHGILTLLAMTGNVAVPGGGFHFPSGLVNTLLGASPQWRNPDPEKRAITIPWLCIPDVMDTDTYNGKPFPVKAFLNIAQNAFSNQSEQKRFLEEILPKIDFVVTHDSRMTDTCRYSDIVLPAAHYFEMDDISCADWIQLSEKAIEPLCEAKGNLEFLALLAQAMGLGEYFDMQPIEAIESIVDGSKAAQAAGITFDRLVKEKVVFNIQRDHYDGVAFSDLVFSSPSGRLEFYQEKPVARMDYGQTIDEQTYRLPRYSHPREAWSESPLKERYPIVLNPEHSRWRAHTSFGQAPWLRELDPEPVVKLSPADAEARGIAPGDTVKVFNGRGSVTLKASVSAGLPEGMCNVAKGWEKWQSMDGCYQELTSIEANPVTLNQSFGDVRVEIERVSQEGGA